MVGGCGGGGEEVVGRLVIKREVEVAVCVCLWFGRVWAASAGGSQPLSQTWQLHTSS